MVDRPGQMETRVSEKGLQYASINVGIHEYLGVKLYFY